MQKITLHSGTSLKGKYKITLVDCSSKKAQRMDDAIGRSKEKIRLLGIDINTYGFKKKILSLFGAEEKKETLIEKYQKETKRHERLLKTFLNSFSKRTFSFENIVPSVGLASLAANLTTLGGSLPAASELRVSYIAVGTGTTAAAAGDTTLDTEVFRAAVDHQASNGAIAKNSLLLGYNDANGNTLEEVGAFAGDASASADSGTLMSRALLSTNVVKTSGIAVFIEVTHTFSDA